MNASWTIPILAALAGPVVAMQDPAPEAGPGLPNLRTPTLGGRQFWTDHHWRQGWRLQQNAVSGHWRLLDPRNVRHAWGGKSACLQSLDRLHPQRDVAGEHVVVLLHGLGRSASSMAGLKQHLERETGWTCVSFEYASTRASIGDHAAALREVVAGLPNDVRLSFVGHSMGNIVLRRAVGDWRRENETVLPRLHRVVMLGPPNQGAAVARQLGRTRLFGWLAGEGATELGAQWKELEPSLANPPCPFGIVAGRISEKAWQNPLIEGDSDFIVLVEETRLPGAADFLEIPQLHTFLMDDEEVRRAVVRFLRTGRFLADAPP